jgi:hypothetical protein
MNSDRKVSVIFKNWILEASQRVHGPKVLEDSH